MVKAPESSRNPLVEYKRFDLSDPNNADPLINKILDDKKSPNHALYRDVLVYYLRELSKPEYDMSLLEARFIAVILWRADIFLDWSFSKTVDELMSSGLRYGDQIRKQVQWAMETIGRYRREAGTDSSSKLKRLLNELVGPDGEILIQLKNSDEAIDITPKEVEEADEAEKSD